MQILFKKYIKIILVFLSAVGVVSFVITIWIFFSKGHLNTKAEIDASYLSGFGAILSGGAGILFNIITVILIWLTYDSQKEEAQATKSLVRKQIELSSKADLFIANSSVYGYIIAAGRGSKRRSYPVSFNDEPLKEEELKNDTTLRNVNINVINVGVGVAKNIKVDWHFDQFKTIEFLLSNIKDDNIDIQYNADKKIATLRIDSYQSRLYNDKRYQDRLDYLLPLRDKENIYQTYIPYNYLLLYFLTLNASANNTSVLKATGPTFHIEDFPPCFCKIEYTDIADYVYKKIFKLSFSGNGFGVRTIIGGAISNEQVLNYEISAFEVNQWPI